MRANRAAALVAALALAGCGEPPPGTGVHEIAPRERQARTEAEFRAGERIGIAGLEKRLRALGLRREEMGRTLDPDYRIAMVTLSIGPDRLADLDVEALARLDLDTNRRLVFTDPAASRLFAELSGEESFRRDQTEAIAELRQYGDWERVPRRRGREAMPLFARRIERWCDYAPGEALNVIEGAWLEYNQALAIGVVSEPVPGRKAAQFDCLRRVVYATELRWNFIGNRGRAAL